MNKFRLWIAAMSTPGHFEFDVFLSHASEDKSKVHRLKTRLQQAKLRVWIDDGEIKGGDAWFQRIVNDLERSFRVVACYSTLAFRSPWVQKEWQTVLTGDIQNTAGRLVPVLIEDCDIPKFWQGYQILDWQDEGEFQKLVKRCRQSAVENIKDPPPPPPIDKASLQRFRDLEDGYFRGRSEFLSEIHDRLFDLDGPRPRNAVAIFGHGGRGKSSVAVRYGIQFVADYPGGLYFAACETHPVTGLGVLAEQLSVQPSRDSAETALRVKSALEQPPLSLLVLDNVVDTDQFPFQDLRQYLPRDNCHCLLTTRRNVLPEFDNLLHIPVLTADESVELLAAYRRDAKAPEHQEAIHRIVQWFDGLAVGLSVVGHFMRLHEGMSWSEYVDGLDLDGLTDDEEYLSNRMYSKRVVQVFDELLRDIEPAHRRTLLYASLLPEDQIPELWLASLLENDQEKREISLPYRSKRRRSPGRMYLARLHGRSTLRWRGELISIHRVLRHRLRERLGFIESPEADSSADSGDGIAALGDRIAARVQQLVLDRSTVCKAERAEGFPRDEVRPLALMVDAVREWGRWAEALQMANNLYDTLRDLGLHEESRMMLQPFAPPDEDDNMLTACAPELPLDDVSEAVSRLGVTESEIAEQLKTGIRPGVSDDDIVALESLAQMHCRKAIEIAEQAFGPDDAFLAMRHSNLALVLQRAFRLDEAEACIQRALEIDEACQSKPVNFAFRYAISSYIYRDRGMLARARELLQMAMDIDIHEDRLYYGRDIKNLAVIELRDQNRDEARRRLVEAREIFAELKLAPDHPYVREVTGLLESEFGE